MEEAHLAFANRCIAEGELRVLRQEALVIELRSAERETGEAVRLLRLLDDTLDLWKQHREMILAALG